MSENNESNVESSEENSEALGEEGSVEVAPTPAEVKKYRQLKLKFNGRETTEDLPFDVDEAQLEWMTRQRQMAMLSQSKSNELSNFEREVGAFLQELKTNPRKALSNPAVGIDIKQLAAEILQEEIEQSQKTPEEIRAEAAERRLQELTEEREKEREDMSVKELERLTEREFERYDNLMSNALETSDLPKSPYIVKKMTEYMIQAVENGIDIEPKDVIPLIRKEMLGDVQELLRSMPPEMVEQLLGTDIITALRKNRVAASKKPPIPVKSNIRDVGQKTEKVSTKVEQKTMKDFFGF